MEKNLLSMYRYLTASFLLSLLSLVLYLFTLAPTYSWGDSADFAIRLAIGDSGWEGTPRDYDIFDLVLRVFRDINIGSLEARANFVSALFGAASVGLTAYLAGMISKSLSVLLFSGCILMVSHTFWLMSVIAEVYTFNLVLILLVYINIYKYKESARYLNLFLVGAFTGLCLSHHSTGLIVLLSQFPFIYTIIQKRKHLEFSIWLTTVILFGALYVQRVVSGINNQQGFLNALGVYRSTNFLNETNNVIEILKFSGFLIYNFPAALALLSLFFIRKLWSYDYKGWQFSNIKYPAASELSIFTAIIVFGGIWSTIPDKHNIFVLAYPFLSIAIASKITYCLRKTNISNIKFAITLILVMFFSPILYLTTYKLTNQIEINLSRARFLNERDNNQYFLWPPKNDDFGPELLANKILNDLPPNSIIIADYTIFMPLSYEIRVQHKRSDLFLIFSESLFDTGLVDILKTSKNRRVFLASNTPPSYYGIDRLHPDLSLRMSGSIFEVILKKGNN